MRKTNVLGLGLLVAFSLCWISCSSPASSGNPGATLNSASTGAASGQAGSSQTGVSTGKVVILLKDAPIDEAKNVWVTVSQIKIHKADPDSFIVIADTEQEFDLLELKNNPAPIASATLEAGAYNQIRMPVVSGKIVFEKEGVDVDYPLEVPSDEIKIPIQLEVVAGGTTEILLDFDAEKSIKITQKGKKDVYLLRPVIIVEKIGNS